ncbi:MAG: 2-polyprenyl-3-methyl-6-methoxy-1,4-benzoquinone monooxygenase [Sutterellaceae bacterium]|nr:2-polyprenyl-3-methyl-6-methoxy-1,4-benzoquinone monooxygenase [Burkholderiaceae bacterium]MDW8430777.1 2-polyprenyl-3-methyl-6-methoxy-1,4-benzoquinone monooxygenase [Sutterellaceae bacterium]
MQTLGFVDRWLASANRALATLAGTPPMQRAYPAAAEPETLQDPAARREAAALMRVNHVGEVCAQALYEAQALGARDPKLRAVFRAAAQQEVDHLAWTERRMEELGGRPSLLNPLWYAGAFTIGLLAARFGDRVSLGFMAETERQVEAHLLNHLQRLPAEDRRSRAIVAAMKADEAQHAEHAMALGGAELPWLARQAMRLAARVMTRTAHYI